MADDMTVGAVGARKVDLTKWKKLTPQEILKEQGKGEEVPPEIVSWAQQMAAIAKIPDDVTYERVDGDVGIDALNKLGIEEEPPVTLEDDNAIQGAETEEPDAIREPGRADGENNMGENDFVLSEEPDEEPFPEDDENDFANDDFSLADTELITDPNEIRKRKERKGIL